MTEQEQLAIRVALARLRGVTIEKRWQHVNDPTWCIYDIRLPGGTYLGSHCGSIEEAASNLPDPFTNAEDYYAMLAWMAQDENLWSSFHAKMKHDLGLDPMATAIECGRAFITASRETITICAARALKIIE